MPTLPSPGAVLPLGNSPFRAHPARGRRRSRVRVPSLPLQVLRPTSQRSRAAVVFGKVDPRLPRCSRSQRVACRRHGSRPPSSAPACPLQRGPDAKSSERAPNAARRLPRGRRSCRLLRRRAHGQRICGHCDCHADAGGRLLRHGRAARRGTSARSSSLTIAARPASIGYLRFRVTVPAGQTIARATLQLFASSKSTSGFTVHRVANTTWGETTINYANAPPIQGRARASGAHRGNAYVSVDVTSLVTRSGLVSLAVKSASPLAARLQVARVGLGPAAARRRDLRSRRRRSATGAAATPAVAAEALRNRRRSAPTIDHVIWIWMENKPYDAVIGSPSAPYENQLAAACGLATNYHGVTHPSLPNYIAATSGGTQGIADDDPPSSHPLDVASIYSQVKAAGQDVARLRGKRPGELPAHVERPVRGEARPGSLLHGHPQRLRELGRADGDNRRAGTSSSTSRTARCPPSRSSRRISAPTPTTAPSRRETPGSSRGSRRSSPRRRTSRAGRSSSSSGTRTTARSRTTSR